MGALLETASPLAPSTRLLPMPASGPRSTTHHRLAFLTNRSLEMASKGPSPPTWTAPSSTSQATNLVLPWRWRPKQQRGFSNPNRAFLGGVGSRVYHVTDCIGNCSQTDIIASIPTGYQKYNITINGMYLSSYLSSFCPHISNGIVSCSHVCIPYSQFTHSVDPLDLFPFLFITGDLNDCLMEEKPTMKYVVRSDLTTKIIQKRHFLGLHLQPSNFHQFSDFCNTSGVFKLSSGLYPKHSQGDTSKVWKRIS